MATNQQHGHYIHDIETCRLHDHGSGRVIAVCSQYAINHGAAEGKPIVKVLNILDQMPSGQTELNRVEKLLLKHAVQIALCTIVGDSPEIIVHCRNGRSRSPAAVAAFFVLFRGLQPADVARWFEMAFPAQRPVTNKHSASGAFPNTAKFSNAIGILYATRGDQKTRDSVAGAVAECHIEGLLLQEYVDAVTKTLLDCLAAPADLSIVPSDDATCLHMTSSFFRAGKVSEGYGLAAEQQAAGRGPSTRSHRDRPENLSKLYPPAKKISIKMEPGEKENHGNVVGADVDRMDADDDDDDDDDDDVEDQEDQEDSDNDDDDDDEDDELNAKVKAKGKAKGKGKGSAKEVQPKAKTPSAVPAVAWETSHGADAEEDRNDKLGGKYVKEGHDEMYLKMSISHGFQGGISALECPRILRMFNGLHCSPELLLKPITKGLVCVDLEAARDYFETYFDSPCILLDGQTLGQEPISGLSPFWFPQVGPFTNELLAAQRSLCRYKATYVSHATKDMAAASTATTEPLKIIELIEAAEVLEEKEKTRRKLEEFDGRHKRARIILRDNIASLKPWMLSRILRRAGVAYEDWGIYDSMKSMMMIFQEFIIFRSCLNGSRRFVTVGDVLATKPYGVTMLGFGGRCDMRHMWSDTVLQILQGSTFKIEPTALSVINDTLTHVLYKLVDVAREYEHRRRLAGPAFGDLEEDDRALYVRSFNVGAEAVELFTSKFQQDFVPLDRPVECVTSRDLTNAFNMVLPLDIGCSNRSEEASKTYKSFADVGFVPGRSLAVQTGLICHPEQVALAVAKLFIALPLSMDCAIQIAGLLESLVEEILELAGETCKWNGLSVISCRHISLAVKNHEGWTKLLAKTAIRDGGVLPSRPPSLFPLRYGKGSKKSDWAFEDVLIRKARKTQSSPAHPVFFVDPRTGLHLSLPGKAPDDSDPVLEPAPLLDALCKQTQAARREEAQAALSAEEAKVMRAGGFVIDATDGPPHRGHQTASAEVFDPSPELLRFRRLREIERLQGSGEPLLPLGEFERFTLEVSSTVKHDMFFSGEAMECVRAYTEDYLVGLYHDAYLITLANGRTVLNWSDVDLVRRLRGEKQ